MVHVVVGGCQMHNAINEHGENRPLVWNRGARKLIPINSFSLWYLTCIGPRMHQLHDEQINKVTRSFQVQSARATFYASNWKSSDLSEFIHCLLDRTNETITSPRLIGPVVLFFFVKSVVTWTSSSSKVDNVFPLTYNRPDGLSSIIIQRINDTYCLFFKIRFFGEFILR